MALLLATWGILDKPLKFLRTHVLHPLRISVDENIPCTYTFLGLLVPFINSKNIIEMAGRSE